MDSTFFQTILIHFRPKLETRKTWNIQENLSKFSFQQPHLAVVLRNGSVWDISFSSDLKSINKNMLIQLPKTGKHRLYFSFPTSGKKLNFLRTDLATDIIQYDPNAYDKRHMKIKKSSLHLQLNDGYLWKNENMKFYHSIEVGSLIWIIGRFITKQGEQQGKRHVF